MPTDAKIGRIKKLASKTLVMAAALLAPLTVLILAANVNSQTPLETAQNDYSFQTVKYQEARAKYENSIANHQAFNTAVSKNDAYLKAKDLAVQINNVYISYLLLVDQRSNLYDWGKGRYFKNEEHTKIEAQIKMLEELRLEAQALDTLEAAKPYLEKLKKHVEGKTLPSAYMLLVKTDMSQLFETKYDFEQTSSQLESYLEKRVTNENRPIYTNWQSLAAGALEKIDVAIKTKEEEVSKINPNKQIKANQNSYDFNTDSQRKLFTGTQDIFREIIGSI